MPHAFRCLSRVRHLGHLRSETIFPTPLNVFPANIFPDHPQQGQKRFGRSSRSLEIELSSGLKYMCLVISSDERGVLVGLDEAKSEPDAPTK
eukprot:CAMPEP_0119024876 /NCGR_PEP_ID=MMETSP1176-20130426/32700_1 /TAXON_ID=265551 /ORGANISM="Synedropsis recta cf, Strain CCMP1620" /LENGTH=91 /DNA_ID=CAMNT_0006980289 /DNA_START=146 /DNA_END=421 /DNA_ORIENTATION=-